MELGQSASWNANSTNKIVKVPSPQAQVAVDEEQESSFIAQNNSEAVFQVK